MCKKAWMVKKIEKDYNALRSAPRSEGVRYNNGSETNFNVAEGFDFAIYKQFLLLMFCLSKSATIASLT